VRVYRTEPVTDELVALSVVGWSKTWVWGGLDGVCLDQVQGGVEEAGQGPIWEIARLQQMLVRLPVVLRLIDM
jgi:hypothetical protein